MNQRHPLAIGYDPVTAAVFLADLAPFAGLSLQQRATEQLRDEDRAVGEDKDIDAVGV